YVAALTRLAVFDGNAPKQGGTFNINHFLVIVGRALRKTAVIHLAEYRYHFGLDFPMGGYDDFGAGKQLEHIDNDGLLDVCLHEVHIGASAYIHDLATLEPFGDDNLFDIAEYGGRFKVILTGKAAWSATSGV